jgi:hypothetical protein
MGIDTNPVIPLAFANALNTDGKVYFSNNVDVRSWSFYEEINVSNFNQDVQYARSGDLGLFAFTNNFKDLIDRPITSHYIPDDKKPDLLLSKNNLSEYISEADEEENTIVDALMQHPFNLKQCAFEPEEMVILFDITFEKCFLFGESNQVGSFLRSGELESLKDKRPDKNYQANTTYWFNPIYKEDGTYKEHLLLLRDFKSLPYSPLHSMQTDTLREMHEQTFEEINIKQNNLDVNEVREFITFTVENGDYYNVSSNMEDVDNVSLWKRNMGIDSLALQDENQVILRNLTCVEDITISSISSTENEEVNGGFISREAYASSYVNLIHTHIPYASNEIPGIVFTTQYSNVPSNLYAQNNGSTVYTAELVDTMHNDLLDDIYHVEVNMNYYFTGLYYDLQGILVNSNLSNYENASANIIGSAMSNLKLKPFAASGSYFQLQYTPSYISAFTNDVTAMYTYNNIGEISDISQTRENLAFGNMCTQSSEFVTILNGTATLDTLETSHMEYTPSSESIRPGMILMRNEVTKALVWKELDIASTTDEDRGIVKTTNQYGRADYESTVKVNGIISMMIELEGRIDDISTRLDALT